MIPNAKDLEAKHPHVPAAFINNIADEGTKQEAVEWLQKVWNERCYLTLALAEARKDAGRYKALRNEGIQKLNGLYVADGGNDWRSVYGEELDAWIDSALLAGQGGEKGETK